MCPINEFFETLELLEGGVVLRRNNKVYKMSDVLSNVRYVPKFKRNILFIDMLDLMFDNQD